MLGSVILQILTSLIVLGMGVMLHRMTNKAAPSLVQTTEGSAFRVKAIPGNSRSPATIKAFISAVLPQLFNMSGKIITDTGETIRDPGIDLDADTTTGTATKVPTASATASMALSEDFRLPFLKNIGALTPPGVFTGRTQVVMVVEQASEPQALADDKWQLTVLAHLNVFNGTGALQKTIPFHREIVVEATTAPLVPEGETPLEQAVYAIRQAGLQITDIREIAR